MKRQNKRFFDAGQYRPMGVGWSVSRAALVGLLLVALWVLLFLPAQGEAQGLAPATPDGPPVALQPSDEGPETEGDLSYGLQSLPSLKAVLIVGPIDGDYGPWTTNEKENMDLVASELAAHGVAVHRFYAPNNGWDAIRQAAEGAHFLFYRGHGVYWTPYPQPTVGGFALSDRFVSSEDIREDLHLAPNAIVMLYGCFTAGTSGSDTGDIGIAEAQRRVAQYSDPFFDIGAGGYYANWFGDAFQKFVRYLFQGQTLGQAYQSYFDFNGETVYRTSHPDHPEMALWLDKDYWDGYWQYNNAFAGLPNETLESLFGAPELGNVPDEVHFLYSIPDGRLVPSSYTVVPLNVGDSTSLTWSLDAVGSWFAVSPSAGKTPSSFTIAPAEFDRLSLASYGGEVTVAVTDPAEVEGSPQRIDVGLTVFDAPFSYVYLPMVVH
jgi:hypothetical protein